MISARDRKDHGFVLRSAKEMMGIKRERVARIGLDVLWLALLSGYIMAGATIVPFHGDEASKIYIGRDFYYLVLERDFGKLTYESKRSRAPGEYRTPLASGSVSNMIYGWLAYMNGLSIDDINRNWRWDWTYAENVEAGRMRVEVLLRASRIASSLQLAAAMVLFFAFAKLTTNRPTAYVASLFFALHPTVLLNGRRAMQEGSLLMGMMLVLVAAAWLIREQKLWRFALMGALAGFTIAAKHTAAFVVATVFLGVFWLPIRHFVRTISMGVRYDRRWFSGLVAACLATLLVFYLLNPGWWRWPLRTAWNFISERSEILYEQSEAYGGYHMLGEQLHGFFRIVFAGENQYYEVHNWAAFPEATEEIRVYQTSAWAGAQLGGNPLVGIVALLLTVAGVMRVFKDRQASMASTILLLVTSGGAALVFIAMTPLPWARYYLPVIPFALLMSAHGLTTLAIWLGRTLSKRQLSSSVLA